MKTPAILGLCVLTALAFGGCATSTPAPEPEQTGTTQTNSMWCATSTPALEPEPEVCIGMPNPWVWVDTLEEAEKLAGFKLGIPETLADNYHAIRFGVLTTTPPLLQATYRSTPTTPTPRQEVEGVQCCVRERVGEDALTPHAKPHTSPSCSCACSGGATTPAPSSPREQANNTAPIPRQEPEGDPSCMCGQSGGGEITIRKELGEGKDISGVYGFERRTTFVRSGVTVTCARPPVSASNPNAWVLTFSTNGYSFSLYSTSPLPDPTLNSLLTPLLP